ncbi:MAG: hypothetical protein IID12_07320 [Candidatus Marinimicrobia bacterium]|nr:hypothetical protein [Candidatus Neomarinimicrobiota bacterium]
MAAKAGLILDSFNEMKTTAINIGDDDFILGTEFLISLRNRANFPFISANLYTKEYQKPLFEQYLIREVGGIRLGIIGVAWDGGNFPSTIDVLDPITKAREIISKISGEVDIIVALTHMPLKVEMSFLDSLPEIDFAIGGHDGKSHIKPKLVGGRGIYKAGAEGQNLGKIDLAYEKRDENIKELSAIFLNLKRVETNLGRLEDGLRGSTIEERYEENKPEAAKIEELKAKKKNLLESINSSVNTASFSIIKLSGEYPSDETIDSYVQEFRKYFPAVEKADELEEELLID